MPINMVQVQDISKLIIATAGTVILKEGCDILML